MGVPSKKIKMGGPTTHLKYLVEYFMQCEHFSIRTFDYGSKIDGGSLINKTESILSKIINTFQVFSLFIYYLVVFRPDIIHINTAFDKKSLIRDIPFSLFSFLFRKKLIFKLHGSSYDLINTQRIFFQYMISLFFLGANRVGVLSEIERNEFINKFGNINKMVVVKNIVLHIKPNDIKEYNLFKREPFKIYGLFISRIIKGKGLDDTIRALPLILKTYPGFVLVVAGDGPDKFRCTNLAKELNVNESIIWLGFIQNEVLPNVFISSDIFIFPSHLPEGMPMSLIEALRSGIPIITTRVRFALNYLKENVNCTFFQAGDVNDIACKVHKLIINKDLQMKMKTFNPGLVEKFSQKIVGKEFEGIYKQMLRK
jgi:glycosyltransferase involved in cell wall biosynthesis